MSVEAFNVLLYHRDILRKNRELKRTQEQELRLSVSRFDMTYMYSTKIMLKAGLNEGLTSLVLFWYQKNLPATENATAITICFAFNLGTGRKKKTSTTESK